MAITFEWRGFDPNTSQWSFLISASNVLGFYGSGGFGSPIQVGQYNDSFHIRTSLTDNTDACPPPHLTNLKYISDTEVSINGGSPVPLSSVQDTHCIRISVISDVNITVVGSRIYAYDGNNVDNPPANVLVKMFKLGDTQWSEPMGRTNALSLGTSTTPATQHHFYFGISISPIASGASNVFVLRFEVDIQ